MWIPLQDVGTDGGCLWHIPGSHHQDIIPHHVRHDITAGHQKDVTVGTNTELFDESKAVPMILKAGDASLHSGYTLHSARPNRSDVPRRAYILAFSGPSQERWMKKDMERWPWIEENLERQRAEKV